MKPSAGTWAAFECRLQTAFLEDKRMATRIIQRARGAAHITTRSDTSAATQKSKAHSKRIKEPLSTSAPLPSGASIALSSVERSPHTALSVRAAAGGRVRGPEEPARVGDEVQGPLLTWTTADVRRAMSQLQ